MEDPRIRKFAQFLINNAVDLKPNDKILIEMHGSAPELAKALIEEVYKAGGKPYFEMFDLKLQAAILSGADNEHMANIASYELQRMRDMDAYIAIRASENISQWKSVPAQGMEAYRKEYWKPIHMDQRCNHTKWSVLRYPNDAMAQLVGMSTEDYEDYYFRACLVDYEKMDKAMKGLVELMEGTDKVRITGPGTDLTFSIKGISVLGMSGKHNIPDGEVYTAPVRDSVNGTIKYNVPSTYEGFRFTDVTLRFENGKIVEASANDTDRINQVFDTDEGARYIGEFALGVNPVIMHPMDDILFDEKIAGSFHFTPGQCYDNAYNGNKSAIHWDLISIQRPEYGGGNIYFDDVLVREDGVFVLEELKALNPENLL
ncbi:MAG: aminopeptidase [Clostridiaceae bacterium]|nr:aminopeptidase [Clostridiaceae bacterium]